MRNYTSIYESKTGELEEALATDIFINDANPSIEEDDTLFLEGLNEVIQRDKISFQGTYFVVDVGHAHLPGLGVELLKNKVDVSYFLPCDTVKRIRETIAYFATDHEGAKKKLEDVVGYATLIDCHRVDEFIDKKLPRYSLSPSVLLSPEKLRKLGLSRIVYLSEGNIDNEVYTGENIEFGVTKDLNDQFRAYRDAGFELLFRGIDKRQRNSRNEDNEREMQHSYEFVDLSSIILGELIQFNYLKKY
jgi:hypothetical protein